MSVSPRAKNSINIHRGFTPAALCIPQMITHENGIQHYRAVQERRGGTGSVSPPSYYQCLLFSSPDTKEFYKVKKKQKILFFLLLCVFFPDLFAVNRAAVVGTERYEFSIRCHIVDAAPLDTCQIVIIPVHEMHGADK